MSVLPQQVTDFLKTSAPFDQLSDADMSDLAKYASLIYLTEENQDTLLEENAGRLFLIQNGQFSVRDSEEGERHLSEGDYFGYHQLIDNISYPLTVKVDKPGLVFCFTAEAFKRAMDLPAVNDFFHGSRADALQNQAVNDSNSMWLYKALNDVIAGTPVQASQNVTIRDAANVMAQNKVSSLLITRNDKLVGIVTDRDLRNRVVAKATDITLPVHTIMTRTPAMLHQYRTMFDAMALMTERNIHHLPVVDRNSRKPLGMITTSDVVRHQRGNVLFIIGELAKADNLYELTRLSWQMPHYFATHAKRLGDFDIAGKVLSQATDIMTRKLIYFYQREHGPAPIKFSWVVYGSQAREDQTMGSDQDNGLLLETMPDHAEGQYFEALSAYVCNGLAKCGIKLCDGNIMASNPALRLSLKQAEGEAKEWVRQPTPAAIMHFNIFLDARCAAGDTDLFHCLQRLRAPVLKQKIFLAALARHNNDVSVPLSMFQKFVYEKGYEHKDTIDLKVKAVAVINNLARIYALASGLTVPATLSRLAALPAGAGLSTKDAQNLRDIWLFLNRLRWRHQLTNKVTDNRVRVSDLSSIEKHQLKAAFKAIERAQQGAVMHFSGGMS
ncbi:putative nucleotidyltransferase substrate binding domain-containing protein [Aestuariibacter sp. A3R04]|uniref:putative nucleotidyltransferase substrate binding domain-containing protein n=1 Tax=Aestuariibacter sp. A3R04 TaxID=2841571 RepID=UPI001C091777|nr:putative nucleotidyltransferase substrate binding domain-containing protein [Aestuariibacter sp. A3R04]MBU3024013.1 CBS domain-containing protein [Aestuariibacter sp. A3R04]